MIQPDTENTGKKKGRVTRRQRKSKTCWRTGKAMSQVALSRLMEIGYFKL